MAYRAQVDVENFDLDTRDRIGDGRIDESKLWEATKLAIDVQLLTGARPSEVRLLTWSEINPSGHFGSLQRSALSHRP